MVGVDEDTVDAVRGEAALDLGQGGGVAHRDQGLGQLVGEGTEPGSEARRQDHRGGHPSSATSAKDMSALSRKEPAKAWGGRCPQSAGASREKYRAPSGRS